MAAPPKSTPSDRRIEALTIDQLSDLMFPGENLPLIEGWANSKPDGPRFRWSEWDPPPAWDPKKDWNDALEELFKLINKHSLSKEELERRGISCPHYWARRDIALAAKQATDERAWRLGLRQFAGRETTKETLEAYRVREDKLRKTARELFALDLAGLAGEFLFRSYTPGEEGLARFDNDKKREAESRYHEDIGALGALPEIVVALYRRADALAAYRDSFKDYGWRFHFIDRLARIWNALTGKNIKGSHPFECFANAAFQCLGASREDNDKHKISENEIRRVAEHVEGINGDGGYPPEARFDWAEQRRRRRELLEQGGGLGHAPPAESDPAGEQ